MEVTGLPSDGKPARSHKTRREAETDEKP